MAFITTPSFFLSINEGLSGFFEGKQDLRQGDPISPLLIVLVMEYFARLMSRMIKRSEFSFNSRCGALNITHLILGNSLRHP